MATAPKDAAQAPAAQLPTQRRPSEIDTVRMALEKLRPQLQMALPKHLTVDRLLRVAITAVQTTPKLLECDRKSLFGAIMTCAQLGLEPDGVLGQAYLVPFGNRVQFIPGYKGLIALARNSGDLSSVIAHEVRENDDFGHWDERTKAYRLDFAHSEPPTHSFDFRKLRGDVMAFYAVARFKDGGVHWDAMARAEVEMIRDRSQGYKAFKAGKTKDNPWHTDFIEMGKKTMIRRISKYLPMSVQKAAAIADAYDTGRHAQLGPAGEVVIDAAAIDAGSDQQQIEKPKGSKLDRFEKSGVDRETGEVLDGALAASDGKPAAESEQGGAAPPHPTQEAAADQGTASAGHDADGVVHEPPVPTLAAPPEDASVKAWTTYRGLLIEAVAKAPSRIWLMAFELGNEDGLKVLERDFPSQHAMVRKAIAARAAELAD